MSDTKELSCIFSQKLYNGINSKKHLHRRCFLTVGTELLLPVLVVNTRTKLGWSAFTQDAASQEERKRG